MPPAPDPLSDALLAIGDWIVALGVLPSLYFLFDYGFLRPMRGRWLWQRGKKRIYVPWWRSGIGTMFFCLGAGFFFISLVVILSLFLGVGYPGREIVRIIGYTISTGSAFWLVIVYEFEKGNSKSVLVPPDQK